MTREERQILVNQYRILAILDKGNAEAHAVNADILEDGHAGLYDSVFSAIADSTSIETGEETHQILTMFRVIDNSIKRLPAEEQKKFSDSRLEFEGFDGNDQGRHYAFAHFIMSKMRLYNEHNPADLNSHSAASLPKYRAMMRVFKSFANRSNLTAEQLQQLREVRDNY